MLRFYKTIKSSFGQESYIKLISDRNIQTCISKFRLSSHCLRIHTGRHERDKNGKNTPSKERLCQSCKAGFIDNELHLFTNCETHTFERNILKNTIDSLIHNSSSLSSTEVLSHIFQSANYRAMMALGKFFKTAFNKRKSENI